MMIPITRKEKYINEIVGGGNTAPETPQTREELFFADILGEVVAPSPITRAEKYLAKIANKYSDDLPEPVTRIERFLARAAGMDISVPTPVTREEMFWADYALIVEKELSGIPPLSFKALAAGTLENYRIYGQNSRNLFDPSTNIVNGSLTSDGSFVNYAVTLVTGYISLPAGTYTFSMANPNYIYVCLYDSEKHHVAKADNYEMWVPKPITFTVPVDGYIRCVIRYDNSAPIEPSDARNLMLNVGAEALPYEPYGLSVGDKINLFDINSPGVKEGYYYDIYGNKQENYRHDTSDFIPCVGGITYTLSFVSKAQYYGVFVNLWSDQKQFIANLSNSGTITELGLLTYTFTPSQNGFITFNFMDPQYEYMNDIILNEGSTALPYEPYGYRIPITNNAETANIYLDEPLAKSGNNADYIDYATQKRHNSDGTESSVTLPEIAVTAGTNTLTVGTEVQPSNVYIKYEGAR